MVSGPRIHDQARERLDDLLYLDSEIFKDIASTTLFMVSHILIRRGLFTVGISPFETVHVLPEAHLVQPFHSLPPHCSHFAASHPLPPPFV